MQSDEDLMAAYVAGDERAFGELFHRYLGAVRGHMRRGYLPGADVEDLVQQVFLQLHRARRDYRPGMPLRPWLMTIARNVKRDHVRRIQRRPPESALLEEIASGHRPEVDRVVLREALERALLRLPASLRSIVEAFWSEHLSHAEIARRYGISRSATKVRIHRAYRALRRILSDQGYRLGRTSNRGAEET